MTITLTLTASGVFYIKHKWPWTFRSLAEGGSHYEGKAMDHELSWMLYLWVFTSNLWAFTLKTKRCNRVWSGWWIKTTVYGQQTTDDLFNQHEFRHEFRHVYAQRYRWCCLPDEDSRWLYDDGNDNVNWACRMLLIYLAQRRKGTRRDTMLREWRTACYANRYEEREDLRNEGSRWLYEKNTSHASFLWQYSAKIRNVLDMVVYIQPFSALSTTFKIK